jgi:hypothetical protein
MKDSIVERLLEQGHITIRIADILINGPSNKKVDIIVGLLEDGPVDNREAIILLKNEDTPRFPFGTPNNNVPIMPLNYPPNQPWINIPGIPGTGNPYWTSPTLTDNISLSNLNKNHSEK